MSIQDDCYLQESPICEKWYEQIKSDLKRYPLLDDDIKDFILQYCMKVVAEVLDE